MPNPARMSNLVSQKPVRVYVLCKTKLGNETVWTQHAKTTGETEATISHMANQTYVLEIKDRESGSTVLTYDFRKIKYYRMKARCWHEVSYEGNKACLRFKENDSLFEKFYDELERVLKMYKKFSKPKNDTKFLDEVKMFEMKKLTPVNESRKAQTLPSRTVTFDQEKILVKNVKSLNVGGGGGTEASSRPSWAGWDPQEANEGRQRQPKKTPAEPKRSLPEIPGTSTVPRKSPKSSISVDGSSAGGVYQNVILSKVPESLWPEESPDTSDDEYVGGESYIAAESLHSRKDSTGSDDAASTLEPKIQPVKKTTKVPPPPPPRSNSDPPIGTTRRGNEPRRPSSDKQTPNQPNPQQNQPQPTSPVEVTRTQNNIQLPKLPIKNPTRKQQTAVEPPSTQPVPTSPGTGRSSVYGTAHAWRCDKCTLLNDAFTVVCAACDWTRTDAWCCIVCTSVVSIDLGRCPSCSQVWRCRLCTCQNQSQDRDMPRCAACNQN